MALKQGSDQARASQSSENAGEVLKIETVSPLRLVRRLQHDGGGMLFRKSGPLYITFLMAIQC